jgi:protein-S-isoprenylcysteine O-methyltransferase Ste14
MRRFTARGGWWVAAQGVVMSAIFVAWMAWGGSWGVVAGVAGFTVAFVGAVLGVAGLGYLGRNLTPYPVPREGTVLVDRGPYAVVRHPIYGGLVLVGLGISIADANPVAIGLSVGLGVLFTAKAGHEERHLERDVAGYADYRRRVRGRILPWIP